jgi:hypothetical protein
VPYPIPVSQGDVLLGLLKLDTRIQSASPLVKFAVRW